MPDAEAGQAHCDEIEDAALKADCELVTARRAVRSDARQARTACPAVTAGSSRDECWFKAAEDAARQGAHQLAAELCEEAGEYRSQCDFHLVQAELVAAAGEVEDREVTAIDARFDEVLAGRMEPGQRATLRMRRTWFRQVFQAQDRQEAPDCSPLSAADRQRACEEAGREALRRQGRGVSQPSPEGAPGAPPGAPSGPPPAGR